LSKLFKRFQQVKRKPDGKPFSAFHVYTIAPLRIRVKHSRCPGPTKERARDPIAFAMGSRARLAQLLYGGDDVNSSEWDSRLWDSHTSVREKLFWLAAEACLLL
jgi:hypothetical protein